MQFAKSVAKYERKENLDDNKQIEWVEVWLATFQIQF